MNELYNTLYDWQKEIVDKNLYRDRFGLYLDMGLGKTLVSLAFAEQKKSDLILIITLNSKVLESEEEKGSWKYWLKVGKYDYLDKSTSPDLQKTHFGYIINYEGLTQKTKREEGKKTTKIILKPNVKQLIKISKRKNVTIIIDECHKVKNKSSVQSKAIKQIIKFMSIYSTNLNVYLLSGTPFTNGYIDLYNQLKLLGCEMNKGDFCDNFCERGNVPGLAGYEQPIVGYKNLEALYHLVHQYAITMKSEEVIKLPEKVFVNIDCTSNYYFNLLTKEKLNGEIIDSELQKRQLANMYLYSKKKEKNVFFRNLDYPDDKYFAETMGQFWLRAREISIGFQGNAEEYIWYDKTRLNKLKNFLDRNEGNYVLFYNYTPELLEIYKICEDLGYNIDVYCGEIKSEIFYNKWVNQSPSERLTNNKNIIISNFASGSTGKNWQAYNKCIIFSMPVFSDYQQGIKRIHRLGQKADTTIYYTFVNNNWLEIDMKKSLDENIDYDLILFANKFNQINKINEM